LRIRSGYPPKPLTGGDPAAAASSVFPSGEALIVEENDDPSVVMPATGQGAASKVKRPEAPTEAPPVNTSGTGVRRVVDADNSCLFTSLGYVLLGKDRSAGMNLRKVVAEEILADQLTYNEAVLNMEPMAYSDWIQHKDHWGGGIELAILSDHFSAEIVAWDVQSLRADKYGQGKDYKQCVHVMYDGLHYDALALSMLEGAPESEDFDITVFHPQDTYVDTQAKAVVAQLKAAKQYTDTQSFQLRCLVCQKGLVGESDAVEHAKQTGHQNFAEYK